MKKALMVAVLIFGVVQSVHSEGYETHTYYNDAYGFKVSYPALTDKNIDKGIAFSIGEETAHGDGNGMYNYQDGARILVSGIWSGFADPVGYEDPEVDLNEQGMVIGCTLNVLLERVKEARGDNITYKHQSGSSAIASGISEGNIFYDKAIYVKDEEYRNRCIFLSVTYPILEKEKYDVVVKGVSSSFTPLKHEKD